MAVLPFRIMRMLHSSVLLLSCVVCVSCSREQTPIFSHDRPSPDEFMVMSYNVRIYGYIDRDDDGQPDDFKPEDEIGALVSIIEQCEPDVLAIQEIGELDALEDLRNRLKKTGIEYSYYDYVANEGSFANLAVLSKHPIVRSNPVTNLSYTIKGDKYPVLRGFQQIEIETSPDRTVTLINAHLKSKRYHPAGQTEMRRNESRLLATHIRHLQRSDPAVNIIVCGDLNDDIHSSPMRELLEDGTTGIRDLPLKDPDGQIWTHFYSYGQIYTRIDYILVNEPMLKCYAAEKSGIIKSMLTDRASDHRPIYATFSYHSQSRDKHEDDSSGSH